MIDLLLPSTDGAVLAQTLIVLGGGGAGLLLTRRRRELRLLVLGASMVLLGLIGLRAIH